MIRLNKLRAAAVLVGALLLLGGLPTSAQARLLYDDPERPAPPAQHASRTLATAVPATINSDVYAYALSPNSRTYFVVAGHLLLHQDPADSTKYLGNIVDYSGNKSYPATADATDPNAPTLTFTSRNGSFTFQGDQYFGTSFYSGTGTSAPSSLNLPASQVYLYGADHALHTASYDIILSERVGSISQPFEYTGTMTIAYDANNRISGGQVTVTNAAGQVVTRPLTRSGYYSTSYLYTLAEIDRKWFGISGTFSGTNFSGWAFAGNGPRTTQWVISGTQS